MCEAVDVHDVPGFLTSLVIVAEKVTIRALGKISSEHFAI